MAKEIVFNVFCSGVYQSHLIVDDDFVNETDINKMSLEEFENILEYVNSHLDEAPLLGEIEWINDVDVDVDDIKAVYEIDN
jgi:hypothetical protein